MVFVSSHLNKIGAIVLAAGKSSRMGQCKSLLEIAGRPMIQHVLDAISQAGITNILVVTGHQPDKIRSAVGARAVCVHNPEFARGGMISSIKAGIAALPCQSSAFLIALGDHPLVRAETIRQMIDQLPDSGILQPIHRGRGGHPVLISADQSQQILQLPSSATLKTWMAENQSRIVELETDDPGILIDVDTPREYHRVLEICRTNAAQEFLCTNTTTLCT